MLRAPRVEYAHERKIRARNKIAYRFAHWPIWIFVFSLAPGPLVFRAFAYGLNRWHLTWFACVLIGTGCAGLRGQLPGVEPRPYILRFCEDRPNPLYRRVCYTFAWNALLNFAALNLAGLVVAVASHKWYLQQIYSYAYLPLLLLIVCLGIAGVLPRVKRSTRGEGIERRYFYGAVWSVTIAQAMLLVLWKSLARSTGAEICKLTLFVAVMVSIGTAAMAGLLPRTRPILPGELMVAD